MREPVDTLVLIRYLMLNCISVGFKCTCTSGFGVACWLRAEQARVPSVPVSYSAPPSFSMQMIFFVLAGKMCDGFCEVNPKSLVLATNVAAVYINVHTGTYM